MDTAPRPSLHTTVLDTQNVASLADFYRSLLGWDYAPGTEKDSGEWRTLLGPGGVRLSFQRVEALPPSTWPSPDVPQQIHLDLTLETVDELRALKPRLLELGAVILQDSLDDPEERLLIVADPAGHPLCVFVP
ncbi:VOC family protein [Kocuria palustris]|uniref:VOC family protein n=1 Tax=Kocuria palustris TaxID=71999 RepID=UPI002042C4BB|nr:VOC family protein [Kocuria palustris]MCM3330662.1 VOC family protein [Kocuria palustris]